MGSVFYVFAALMVIGGIRSAFDGSTPLLARMSVTLGRLGGVGLGFLCGVHGQLVLAFVCLIAGESIGRIGSEMALERKKVRLVKLSSNEPESGQTP